MIPDYYDPRKVGELAKAAPALPPPDEELAVFSPGEIASPLRHVLRKVAWLLWSAVHVFLRRRCLLR
jgi:hypothetical protein